MNKTKSKTKKTWKRQFKEFSTVRDYFISRLIATSKKNVYNKQIINASVMFPECFFSVSASYKP